MSERLLKNIIKQDEDFQKFAMGRDYGETLGEERGKTLGLQEGKVLGLQEGKVLGLQEGKTLGIEQTRRDMVLEMYKKDLPIDLIIDISKLSETEVNEIIASDSKKKR